MIFANDGAVFTLTFPNKLQYDSKHQKKVSTTSCKYFSAASVHLHFNKICQIHGKLKRVLLPKWTDFWPNWADLHFSLDKNVSTQICSFWPKDCFQFSKNLTYPSNLQWVLDSKKILAKMEFPFLLAVLWHYNQKKVRTISCKYFSAARVPLHFIKICQIHGKLKRVLLPKWTDFWPN